MRKNKERGAIVVEATISLTAFIFTIFTILSIVNICYIQSKIGLSLNSAAKEISQYSYLYYKFGVNELDGSISAGTEDEKEVATSTIDGIGTFMSSMADAKTDAESLDFDSMMNDINSGVDEVDSLITMYADKLADDPKGFIVGMGKMAGSELKEEAKVVLGKVLAKTFMKKNLKAFPGDDPNDFLIRHGIEDGMAGLDFNYTALMAYGTSNQIQLVCTYDVKVIQLLDIDYTFTFRQCAQTTAWGDGISLITPGQSTETMTASSKWDMGPAARGQYIVGEEKAKYNYVSTHKGYDAYDNTAGKNEFITIASIDTTTKSYQTQKQLQDKLKLVYQSVEKKVSKLDDPITVQDKDGNKVELASPADTRTYKMVIVVPDSQVTSQTLRDAIKVFQLENPGVVVEVKGGYGDPTPPKEPETDTETNTETNTEV